MTRTGLWRPRIVAWGIGSLGKRFVMGYCAVCYLLAIDGRWAHTWWNSWGENVRPDAASALAGRNHRRLAPIVEAVKGHNVLEVRHLIFRHDCP